MNICSFPPLGCKLLCFPSAFNLTTGPVHFEILLRSRYSYYISEYMLSLKVYYMASGRGPAGPRRPACRAPCRVWRPCRPRLCAAFRRQRTLRCPRPRHGGGRPARLSTASRSRGGRACARYNGIAMGGGRGGCYGGVRMQWVQGAGFEPTNP